MVLRRIEGVEDADVSYESGKAVVTYDPAVTSPEDFIPELERMTGFGAEVVDGGGGELSGGPGVERAEHENHDMHEHDTPEHEHEGRSSS